MVVWYLVHPIGNVVVPASAPLGGRPVILPNALLSATKLSCNSKIFYSIFVSSKKKTHKALGGVKMTSLTVLDVIL